MILGDHGLADQILQQAAAALGEILAHAHIRGSVEVGEMGGETADVEHFLTGFGVGADHRVFGIGELGFQREALFVGHPRAEAGFDRMARF